MLREIPQGIGGIRYHRYVQGDAGGGFNEKGGRE